MYSFDHSTPFNYDKDKVFELCEKVRNAEVRAHKAVCCYYASEDALNKAKGSLEEAEEANTSLDEANKAFLDAKEVMDRANSEYSATKAYVESALVDEAADTIIGDMSCIDSSVDQFSVTVVMGINWKPDDKGWKMFNMLELKLIEKGLLRPVQQFSPFSESYGTYTLYKFHLVFGNYLSRMDEELPENIEKEAEDYAEWAKDFAWELSFRRPVNQYTIQKKVPVHLTNSALLYAFIKALREVNDGMRFNWWKVHPEGFIMVNLA